MSSSLSPRSKKSGFTLIELLIVIAIIAVLLGLGYPALRNALNTAKAAKCVVQLRQSSSPLILSAIDHGNRLAVFGGGGGSFEFRPYFIVAGEEGETDIMKCPTGSKEGLAHWHTYGVNFGDTPEARAEWQRETRTDSNERSGLFHMLNVAIVENPAAVLLIADSQNGSGKQIFRINTADGDIALRHKNRANAAFLDGSARTLTLSELKDYNMRAAYTFEDGAREGTLVTIE